MSMMLLRCRKRATATTVNFNSIECRVEVDEGRRDDTNELLITYLYLLVAIAIVFVFVQCCNLVALCNVLIVNVSIVMYSIDR